MRQSLFDCLSLAHSFYANPRWQGCLPLKLQTMNKVCCPNIQKSDTYLASSQSSYLPLETLPIPSLPLISKKCPQKMVSLINFGITNSLCILDHVRPTVCETLLSNLHDTPALILFICGGYTIVSCNILSIYPTHQLIQQLRIVVDP